jgi:hypothetical protein
MDPLLYLLDTIQITFTALLLYWWIWLPLILFFIFWGSFVLLNRMQFLTTLKWVLLEVRFPSDAHKSLRAMEQIFIALHGIAPPPKAIRDKFNAFRDKNFKGKVPGWYSFEMVGDSAEIHFYVRALEDSRDLVESLIYGHYPDAEITQVPDYISQWPPMVPNVEFDMNAVELGLIKENIIPIKTYPEFEEEHAGKDDARVVDPLAPLVQAMGGLGFAERVGIQMLIRPTGGDWIKKDQAALDKLFGKPEKKEQGVADQFFTGLEGTVKGIFNAAPVEKKEEKKEEGKPFNQLSPGVQDIIKAIERGTSKLAFETGIRMIYIARREAYNKTRLGSIQGAFRQFSTFALNGFKPAFAPEVKKGFNKEEKTLQNKIKLYKRYRNREFFEKPFVLNTEELTTVYHFPDVSVKAPALPRVEAKKGEPPSGLPVV